MTWTRITKVRSLTDGRRKYAIDRNEKGTLRCSCLAFRYSHDRRCKHLSTMDRQLPLRLSA